MESSRKFKIIVNSKECGTCSGATPSAVAKKVVKKLCGKSNKMVKFSLKECKRGCERECGPYQGRMEKLDRPCKRGGKTITHRVICGKVKKMMGGKIRWTGILDKTDFVCDNEEDKVKRHIFTREPYIFFGKDKNNNNLMRYVAHNEKIDGVKKAIFKVLTYSNDINTIPIKNVSFIAIDQLIEYLEIIRKNKADFCKTIYTAAIDEKRIYDGYLDNIHTRNGSTSRLINRDKYNVYRIENTLKSIE